MIGGSEDSEARCAKRHGTGGTAGSAAARSQKRSKARWVFGGRWDESRRLRLRGSSSPRRQANMRCARDARWLTGRRQPSPWCSIVQTRACRDRRGLGSASAQARGGGAGDVTRVSWRSGPTRATPERRAMDARRRDSGPCPAKRPAARGPPARASAPTGPRCGAISTRAIAAGRSGAALRSTAPITGRSIASSTGGVRAGGALWQGIGGGGRCGRRLPVRAMPDGLLPISGGAQGQKDWAGTPCQCMRGDGRDAAVGQLLCEAIAPAQLTIALEAVAHLEAPARGLSCHPFGPSVRAGRAY
jgi:hypothetical protein